MGFTFWLGRKKDWHAIFAIAAYSLFVVGIVMLNASATFEVPMSTLGCTYLEGNDTWNPICNAYAHTVIYTLDATVMTVVNVLVLIGAFFILLIGFERLVVK